MTSNPDGRTVASFYHRGYSRRMGLNIKNEEVERLAAEVARMAGESKTQAIRQALEERRRRLAVRVARRDRRADLEAFLQREIWSQVSETLLGRRLSRRAEDRILGYGSHGV